MKILKIDEILFGLGLAMYPSGHLFLMTLHPQILRYANPVPLYGIPAANGLPGPQGKVAVKNGGIVQPTPPE